MSSRANGVPPDDWRRQGQEKYLKGVPIKRGPWRMLKPSWDHDHCEFCYVTFSPYDGDLKSGYSTLDEYRWICEACFEAFRDEFGWSLVSEPAERGEGLA
jgi:hypothetical protein